MKNLTQLDRYTSLLDFLDKKFKEDININDIEEISFYSYRNINRIFMALHHESIGKYIKRMKLEKAAQYLKYSNTSITDIAYEIGYSDIAAFSKAFKNQFNCAPSQFRLTQEIKHTIQKKSIDHKHPSPLLAYEIEELPSIAILYLTYQGTYDNIKGIKETWDRLINYATKKGLFNKDTVCLAEILDDNEITENVYCRYNAGIIIENTKTVESDGLFRTKIIPEQKYLKFIHKGSHEDSLLTYDRIYSYWITDISLELEDKPTLEFFLNDDATTPASELLTEIYIPIKS